MSGASGHPLSHRWRIWEHKVTNSKGQWGDNMQCVADFNTVEDFWRYYNNIPRPSQVFYDGQTRKRVGDRTVDGYSLFKEGIKPEWEDEANANGGEWSCRKSMPIMQVDRFWENLVLGCIGETIDPGDDVCGVRVVDKSKGSQSLYRLELWLRRKDPQTRESRLLERMTACLADGATNPKAVPEFGFKEH
ncbi:unnamed protein product [Phaeothamnion confervicola]